MANTFTQIHLHFVFVVKYRNGLIQPTWKVELYKYITAIIQHHNHKVLAINGMPDHIHILIGMRPNQSISALLQDVKRSSSKWINEKRFCRGKFEWQEGYGAFSYSNTDVQHVIQYIHNQEIHHRKTTFRDEYLELLNTFDIPFDEKYLFKEPSDKS